MLKNIRYILFIFFSVAILSCKKDFLEVAPKGSLIATKTSEYENLLYNSLALGGDVPSAPSGDEVATLSTYFNASSNRLQRLFRWEADVYEPDENAAEIQTPIGSIYIYNKIINEVMASTGGSPELKTSLQSEAKASRAYFNMMLANYYSKPYYQATATTDLSIPLITLADVTQPSFKRATVAEVYANMINDLRTSIPNIPVNQPHRLRMTKAAAEMTLAKIYWYMADYQSALDLIVSAKSHLPTSFENGIYDYNITYASGTWSIPSGYNNAESLLTRTSLSTWVSSSNDILLAPWAYRLYSTNDRRLRAFSMAPYLGTGTLPGGLARRIGPFGSQIAQGVSLPDVELMKAECEARLNKMTDALATLQAFRKKRMPDAEATVNITDRNTLVRFIVEERVREFALYGLRWFDMRRLSNDPLFRGVRYEHVQYNGQSGAALQTYTLSPERMTFRFPRSVIDANPDMTNNP